jgi:formylglycine-generating enzyme required for sulfatase activity
MSTVLRVLVIGLLLLLLLPGGEASAFLPRDDIQVTSKIVVNRGERSPLSGCRVDDTVETYLKREGWFGLVGASPQAAAGAEGDQTGLRCAREPAAQEITPDAPADSAPASAQYLLTGAITTIARSHRQMEDERVIEIEIAVDLRRVSGVGPNGEGAYEESLLKRNMFFADPGEVFVPLYVADNGGRGESGVSEVFLKIVVGPPPAGPETIYGAITVTTDLEAADLLLDGGLVGALPAEGETTLHNVRTGLREVRVRAASGGEVAKMVRVVAGRRSLAHLRQGAGRKERPELRLTPLGTNEQGFEEFRRDIDGAVVVRIPAGEFLMGNLETERSPMEHKVYVSEFLMDRTGVTWGQFKAFSEATGIPLPRYEPYWGIHDDHPMVYVTWEEAKAYCEWSGARLPTEAEREKAARGTDGRKFPWGDEEPSAELGVHRRTWGYIATGAVGELPAGSSPYGLQDMGGNVWEWCADWYDGDYYAESPYRDPKGPSLGSAHVVRGGSWDSRPTVLSASCRSWGHRGYRDGDFGFRCAMNASAPD